MAEGPGGKEVGRISIRVVPDTSKFRQTLKARLEEIENSLRATVEVDVHLDEAGALGKMRGLMARLKAQARGGVTVDVDVDSQAASEGLSKAVGGLGGRGFGGFGQGLLTAAAVAALAAPALALVSGLLTALPAIATAAVLPIGAVVLGLDGLKKAAGVLKAPLADLKKTMSQAFQDKFTPILTKLKDIFPLLKQEMPGIANGLGDIAKSIVNTVTSGSGMDKIRSTIQNISKTLSELNLSGFTSGILGLADGVSKKFPAISKYISEAGDSFSKWVEKVTADGSLSTAMDNLGATIKEILGLVGDLAKQGFDFLADPAFGEKMKQFVESIRNIVDKILPDLKNLFMQVSDIVKGISDVVDKISQFKVEHETDPNKVKEDLQKRAQDSQSKGTGEANLPGWFDPEGWAVDTKKWFMDTWSQIKTWFDGWVSGWDISNLTGIFTGAWDSIYNAAIMSFASIATTVQNAWTGITSFISDTGSSVGGAVSAAWNSVVSATSSAWESVKSSVSSAWEAVKSAVSTGIDTVVSFIAALPGKIVAAMGNLAGALVAAGKALIDGLLSGIKSGVQSVLDFASGIASKIAAVKGPLPYDRKVLTPNGEALMEGLGDGISNGLSPVLQQAKDIATQIFQAFKDVFGSAPGGIAFNLAGGGGSGLGGITSSLDGVSNSAQGVRSQLDKVGATTGKMSQETKELKAQLDLQAQTLELQKKQLEVDKAQTTDKAKRAEIQAQIDKLDLQKKNLAVQQQELKMSGQQGDQADNMLKTYQDLSNIPKNFAQATGDQLLGDLGVQGGALQDVGGQLMDWGWQQAQQFVFNVSSADEAIAVKNNQINKQALQWKDRT